MEERLKVLCYNAIGYMLEHKDSYYSMQEECEFIAEYLGSTIEELTELGVLDYEDLIKGDN